MREHLEREIGPLQTGAALPTTTSDSEWVRLPKPGALCPLTGLSRTSLYSLCQQGEIKSIVLRSPGAKRGIRLIKRESLLAYVSVLLLVLSNALLAANWFIFACGLALLTMIRLRTRIEEEKLLERFGDEYRHYKERTGAFFPRW
jgi:hypothetical protein